MTFLFADPTELWLEIAPDLQDQAWQQSQTCASPSSCWRAYLNQLCLETVLPWLQAEYEPQAESLDRGSWQSIWDATNGSAILMGNKQLVLLPTEAIDNDELRVPQEWIDIPDWAGDYYLAVQVDPDERWLRVWGYTTHDRLKTQGTYDPRDRTYHLAAEDLILDLNVLWVTRQLCPEETTRAPVEALSPVSGVRAENLVQRLSQGAIASPRQEIPFPLWGALFSCDRWRDELFSERCHPSTLGPVRLGQWFEQLFETSWQSLETLFPESGHFAGSFRRKTEEDSEAPVKRVKAIALEEQTIVLLVALSTEPDGRIGVRIQLHPDRDRAYLPPHLHLALLAATGETLRTVEARTQDNFIQLPPFKCQPGFCFDLQVTLNKRSITESFLV